MVIQIILMVLFVERNNLGKPLCKVTLNINEILLNKKGTIKKVIQIKFTALQVFILNFLQALCKPIKVK